jgi:hypothetical protein
VWIGGELVVLSTGVVVDLEDRGVSVPLTQPMRDISNSLAQGFSSIVSLSGRTSMPTLQVAEQ